MTKKELQKLQKSSAILKLQPSLLLKYLELIKLLKV